MFPKNKLIEEIDQFPEDAFESVYHILNHLRLELIKKNRKPKKTFSDEFLKTFGSWQDSRSTEQIVKEISDARFFSKKKIEL